MKEPDVGKSTFVECDWSNFYPGAEEVMLPNATKPLGKSVMLEMFVDSNHPDNKVSQCLRTSFVIIFNFFYD